VTATTARRSAHRFAAAEQEPDRRIDYILAGIEVSARVVCDAPRSGGWPSDHFGVAATLWLPDRQ
jgi:endonuclease/exonuclease/phosphatase family metal-dependent hydrolase